MLSQTRGGYWLYRLDRIGEIKAVSEGDKLDYATRFSLQDHRRQTYLLDSGDLMQIQFVYRYYPQTALDQFPGSRVIRHNADGSVVIEAFARLDGALLWLLSQGAALKVISPPSLIKRMREELMAALNQYKQ
ncbi:helix-turn-helix transcriptional regulator [Lacticaseibacillus rhamnosus]|nr:WYL domain-containing protein [Lacticaseibacillus rhamnosus]